MFDDTIAKIREEIAELEQFDYTSDDLILASNITGRIRKWLKELEKQMDEKDERIEQLVAENEGMAWTSLDNITDLKLKIMEKDERIKELEEDLEAANEKAQKERNELRDEYHEQLKLHYSELKATKKELARKDEKIEKLYHDLDDSDIEINSLREDNDVLVERIEKLENERRISIPCKIIDELQDSREKVEELTKHNDDLRRDNEFIGRLIEGKNERLLQLERDLKAANQKIEKLNMELSAARISSGTKVSTMYIDLNVRVRGVDEAFKAIDEEVVSKVNKEI